MAKVVVMGAGIGGISAAYGLKEKLGDKHQVSVVHPVDYFQFVPSNIWAGVGTRDRAAITIELAPHLKKKNIEFIAQEVMKINAKKNQLELKDKTRIDYDYLVITTGAKLAFDEVPGAGPHGGYTHSVCTIDHAESTYSAYQKLVENPGPVIIGTMPGASCFGPAYEFAFVLSHDLRKRGIRHKVPIKFVTSEPYIGHLGLGGVNDSKAMLESEFRKHNIEWICNAKVERVEEEKMFVSELDQDGQLIKNHDLPFAFSMMIPAFKGVDAVAEVKDMVNPRGFVMVDEYQRNTSYQNIYAAGVCIALAPFEATAVPTGMPKTGYMIETMVAAIVENIAADIEDKPLNAVASKNAICLADMGNTGIAFVAKPQIPPRNVDWAKKGKWVHWSKVAFEKYFLYKARNGKTEPVFEKLLIKLLGIQKLE